LQLGLENALVATLLAVPATAAGVLLRKRPAWVHGLWLLVLLKLVTPPLWEVPFEVPSAFRAAAVAVESDTPTGLDPGVELIALEDLESAQADVEIGADAPVQPGPLTARQLFGAIAGVWAAGSAVVVALSLARIRRFRRVLALATDAPEALSARVAELADRVGLASPPEVLTIPGGVSPMVWALGGRPRLIVPEDLWKVLDGTQRETLIVHELAHLRRGDHWVRWLELGVAALYWWLPAAWWARRQLREAEERCCDAWVLWALPRAARAYAETLIETVDYLADARTATPSLASGFGGSSQLKRRLTVILRGGVSRGLGRGGSLAALGLAIGLLPWNPTLAVLVTSDDKPNGQVVIRKVERTEAIPLIVHRVGETPVVLDTIDLKGVDVVADVELVLGDDGKVIQEKVTGREGIKEAIEKLKAELKALRTKDGGTAEADALAKAISALEAAARGEGRPGEVHQVRIIRRTEKGEGDGKAKDAAASPEEKEKQEAELKRLTEEVEASRSEVAKATKRLVEAQQKLLQAKRTAVNKVVRGDVVYRVDPKLDPKTAAIQKEHRAIVEYKALTDGQAKTLNVQPRGLMLKPLGDSDQDRRIAELEKKLAKVLDELEALKKEGRGK
jgi:beta-lactamase regulating signal transducer with metallopeptidase domain